MMSSETKSPERPSDTPRDKPLTERAEHANLERPGAQAHPRAASQWSWRDPVMAWRMH